MARVNVLVGIFNSDEYQKAFEEVVLEEHIAQADLLLEKEVDNYEEGGYMVVKVDGELTKNKQPASFIFETDGNSEFDVLEFVYKEYVQ